ncbi:ribosomal L7Ae/L30e/S12e/Gadd45 family protein [Clostridium hydrogenum]|uniref:ribosomal L7Ae/L30e/S12e/Gadd45 family protein n=1 Tax=Clostridium hydrogenum TaxID=2855764 RepID=UPI001F1F89C0|nr:ribosomal L7Ae/L30e/S12e/Gadd45 family protein [Clostridium hydrogenum]
MNNKFLQFLGITKKSGNLLEGYNKCEEALKYGKAKLIILSEDVSQNTKDKFENYSLRFNVPIINNGFLSEELGKILGRKEIKVLCIIDYKMSTKLIELLKQENN